VTGENRAKSFATTASLILVLGLTGCASSTTPEQTATASAATFDSERWIKNVKFDREKCVHDLIDRGILTGLPEDKVSKLLGAPDSKESNHWDYEIRPENASFETLFVIFENGKVSKCELKSNP